MDLTEPERRLVDHVARGRVLGLTGEKIRARVIREIVRGNLVDAPDPYGVRLRGATISGRVDLANITSDVRVALTACRLDEGITARKAHLPSLRLDRCVLSHPTRSAVDLDQLVVDELGMVRVTVDGHTALAAVTAEYASVGVLSLLGAWISNGNGSALYADGLRVDRDCVLHGLVARGIGSGRAAVRLKRAHIGGNLNLIGAHLRQENGTALNAEALRVEGNMDLRGGFVAVGAGDAGAVRLMSARVGGTLGANGACLWNETGPALTADRLVVGGNVRLADGFIAVGADRSGTVRLLSADVGQQLVLDGAVVVNRTGSAVVADRLVVGGNVRLTGGFLALGAGESGAVRLPGADLGGQLVCEGTLRNRTGPALTLDRTRIAGDLFLRKGFTALGGGDAVVVLSAVRVGRAFELDLGKVWHASGSRAKMLVDGLVYPNLAKRVAPRDWLRSLREATPGYTAQPYQQLAAMHRAAGHDGEARRVLMAQRRDQVDRLALTSRAERLWARVTGVTLGYGYQPWRALLCLLGVLLLAVTLSIVLGGRGGLANPEGAGCTVVERVGVGLDLGTPLVNTGARAACAPTDTAAGQAVTVAGWVLRLLAWAFATLFVAGFTGAVRKS